MKTSKRAYAAVSLLVGLGSAFPALATSVLGGLGPSRNAIDVFKFTCPARTLSATGQIEDLDPPSNRPAKLRVKVGKGHRFVLAEDPNEGTSFPSPSPTVELKKGPGVYVVLVYATAKRGERYRVTIFCKRSNGALTNPVSFTITQNQ